MKYDLAIIGSGPAGLTAGIYASRAQLSTVIFEGPLPGGQLMTTTIVENWPGLVSVQGPDLMIEMQKHAKHYGSSFLSNSITKVDFSQKPFKLFTESNQLIEADSVIIATGAINKKLGCPGEQEYFAKGVSTCATCDAPFYKDKEVVVIGGGNTAVTEADHLAHFAKKITVIQILGELSATDPLKFKILNNPKINFLYHSTVKEIKGNGSNVTEIVIENTQSKTLSTLPTQGVFLAIGFNPNTSIFKDHINIDKYGYIIVTNHTKTSKDGVFAAGDVADFRYRQAITSAGAGCMAALDAQTYLAQQKIK